MSDKIKFRTIKNYMNSPKCLDVLRACVEIENNNKEITRKKLEKTTGLSRTALGNILMAMISKKQEKPEIIIRTIKGKNSFYKINDELFRSWFNLPNSDSIFESPKIAFLLVLKEENPAEKFGLPLNTIGDIIKFYNFYKYFKSWQE